MRNFDEVWDAETEDDRAFVLRGERFVLKQAVRPETMAEKLGSLDRVRQQDDATIADVMVAVDEFVLAMVEPGDDAEGRYRKIREREENGLNAARMLQLQQWIVERQTTLVEDQTGRPTGSPRASSGGRRTAPTSSTGGSSSQALRAVSGR